MPDERPQIVCVSSHNINARVTVEVTLASGEKRVHSIAIHMDPLVWTKNSLALQMQESAERGQRTLGGKALWVG